MTEQTNHTNNRLATLPEAPASVTVKFSLKGFDTMLTLRDHSGYELLKKLETALDTLEKMGAEPTAHRQPATPQDNGQEPDGKICPLHSAKMTRREKQGDVWYSHKAYSPDGAEYWCRGESD